MSILRKLSLKHFGPWLKDQNGVIGQLAHQTRVVTFGIRADLARIHSVDGVENSLRRGATTELNLTCTMLGFDLGYVGP